MHGGAHPYLCRGAASVGSLRRGIGAEAERICCSSETGVPRTAVRLDAPSSLVSETSRADCASSKAEGSSTCVSGKQRPMSAHDGIVRDMTVRTRGARACSIGQSKSAGWFMAKLRPISAAAQPAHRDRVRRATRAGGERAVSGRRPAIGRHKQ